MTALCNTRLLFLAPVRDLIRGVAAFAPRLLGAHSAPLLALLASDDAEVAEFGAQILAQAGRELEVPADAYPQVQSAVPGSGRQGRCGSPLWRRKLNHCQNPAPSHLAEVVLMRCLADWPCSEAGLLDASASTPAVRSRPA